MNKNLLLLFALSINICFSEETKLQIDIYTESLCPDCRNFLITSFKKAFETKDLSSLYEYNLYVHGNANQELSNDGWNFTCQHGPKECMGNLMQNCVLNITRNSEKGFKFVICFEENIKVFKKNIDKIGNYCSKIHQINFTEIQNCMESKFGNELMHEVATKTENLTPKNTYVPWIVVNGVHDEQAETEIMENMVEFICKKQTSVGEYINSCQKSHRNFLKLLNHGHY